jgi:D-3-phosphoglycerate dehydrogenase / 2-oxoglutarate reductase
MPPAAITAAEQTIALPFSLARHIPTAKSGTKAVKWETSRFLGVEVHHKVLGMLGL